MKATTSDHMLNIMQNIDPLYRMLQTLQDQTATSTEYTDDASVLMKDLHM